MWGLGVFALYKVVSFSIVGVVRRGLQGSSQDVFVSMASRWQALCRVGSVSLSKAPFGPLYERVDRIQVVVGVRECISVGVQLMYYGRVSWLQNKDVHVQVLRYDPSLGSRCYWCVSSACPSTCYGFCYRVEDSLCLLRSFYGCG